MAVPFRKFSFVLRFDQSRIVAVPHSVQLERLSTFLLGLGEIHPLLKNWYRQGGSKSEALSKPVVGDVQQLQSEAQDNLDAEVPSWLRVSLWNGQDDPFAGGLALHYSAHDQGTMSCMRFEDGGALIAAFDDVRQVVLRILQLAVSLWPEIDWAVFAPREHYLRSKVFKDRQTIGWIGFCPHSLKAEDYPEADELIELPERGTLVVSCPAAMNEQSSADVQRVGSLDIRLLDKGLLPFFVS